MSHSLLFYKERYLDIKNKITLMSFHVTFNQSYNEFIVLLNEK